MNGILEVVLNLVHFLLTYPALLVALVGALLVITRLAFLFRQRRMQRKADHAYNGPIQDE